MTDTLVVLGNFNIISNGELSSGLEAVQVLLLCRPRSGPGTTLLRNNPTRRPFPAFSDRWMGSWMIAYAGCICLGFFALFLKWD